MSEFDTRIRRLEDEITFLKTSKIKSSSTLKTAEANTSISLDLKMDSYKTSVYSAKRAIITLTTTQSGNFLSSLTLNTSSVDGRSYDLYRRYSSEGIVVFVLLVVSGSESDWQTLYDGGSVTVNMGLNLRATSGFTFSVAYEDNDLG